MPSLVFPDQPQNTSRLQLPAVNHTIAFNNSDSRTAEQNVEILLYILASQVQTEYNQAQLLGVSYIAGGIAPHRRRSDNIKLFQKITLTFKAGGVVPDTPRTRQYFVIRNEFPDRWDLWNLNADWYYWPPLIWLRDRRAIDWPHMHMPVALADTLLKAAGYEGPYEIVRLHEMVLEARPLQYCFQGFWHGSEARSVVVEVETGEVSEVNYDCVVNLVNDVQGTEVTVQ